MLDSIKLWYIPNETTCQGSDDKSGKVPTVD